MFIILHEPELGTGPREVMVAVPRIEEIMTEVSGPGSRIKFMDGGGTTVNETVADIADLIKAAGWGVARAAEAKKEGAK